MIKRGHAENMLGNVIGRARSLQNPIFEVQMVVVFGSFLQFEKEEIGDLDVAIAFRQKEPERPLYITDQSWKNIGMEVLKNSIPDLSLVNLDHMQDDDIGNRINLVVYDADSV